MTLQRFAPAALAVACLAVCAGARADDSAFRFSGFGTIGAVHTDNSDVEYAIPGQKIGHGAKTDGVSFIPDTKLGVQGDYKLNNTFSATAQLRSQYNGKGSYDPSVEWAFGKARFLDDWSVRLGRISTPVFMISDFRDVNFANTWVRPPIEVYSQVVFSHTDGGDLSYQHSFGSVTVSSSVFTGNAKATYNTANVSLKNQLGLNLTAETDGGLTVRFGYSQGDLSITSQNFNKLATSLSAPATLGLLTGLSPAAAADSRTLAGVLLDNGDKASFIGVGATWDHDNWILSSEFTKRKAGGAVSDTTGWYASAGYRVGKFTPYVYAAQLKVDKLKMVSPETHLPLASVPSLYRPTVGGLYHNVDYVIGLQDTGQKTIAIGSRWDAMRNTAFKVQLESIKPDGRFGSFNSVVAPSAANGYAASANVKDKTINVLSLSVDFVF